MDRHDAMPSLQPNPELEFSVPVDVTQLPSAGRDYSISAKDFERKRVAARLNILEINELSAQVHLEPAIGNLIQVSGRLTAKVVQACVVSLEPLRATIEEDFAVTFTRVAPKASAEIDLDPNDEPPEAIYGDVLDIGETVVEQLVLLLDPYPRAPGVVFETHVVGAPTSQKDNVSPFAVLAKLKTKS